MPASSSVETGAKGFSGIVGRSAILVLRSGAVGLLLLSIVAGLIGIKEPTANINMTLFWVVFLLGFAYLTAIVGDTFAIINPWKTILDICEKCGLDLSKARVSYPVSLGYLPALFCYAALIWIELFTEQTPFGLSIALIIYGIIVFVGAWLFGRATWFRYGEFFGLFFRLIGLMAPVAYVRTSGQSEWQWRLRLPFSDLVDEHKEHWSLLLFVLFMLSSTIYDGLHDTQVWLNIYWKHLLQLIEPLWHADNPRERVDTHHKLAHRLPAGRSHFPFGTICRDLPVCHCGCEKGRKDKGPCGRTGAAICVLAYSHCIRLQHNPLLYVSRYADASAAVAGLGSVRLRLEPDASPHGACGLGAPRHGPHLAHASGVDLDRSSCQRLCGAYDIAQGLSFSPSGAADPDSYAPSHDDLHKRRTLDSFLASFTACYGCGWLKHGDLANGASERPR